MSLTDRLSLLRASVGSLLKRPRASALTFAVVSESTQASDFARRWAELRARTAPGASAANGEASNPLRRYFDSVVEGPGIWKWLHYFEIYHRHLQRFVGKPVTVVEVGVYSGGSLPMWREYFGAECQIHGVDIMPECRVYGSEANRTTIHIGDQGDRSFWRSFRSIVPDVDVLIDDGGHRPEQQIVTLEEMLPHLRPGGVYVCEDMGRRFAAYVQAFSSALYEYRSKSESELASDASLLQSEIDSVHLYPFVAVIEKRSTPLPRFQSVRHGTQWQPFPG